MPLHPLVVHAAVVFVPLAALAAILFVVPKWRWLVRWPALVLAVGGAAAVQIAVMTARDLEKIRHLESSPLVHTHEEWGQRAPDRDVDLRGAGGGRVLGAART